jgi:hypothetical protein
LELGYPTVSEGGQSIVGWRQKRGERESRRQQSTGGDEVLRRCLFRMTAALLTATLLQPTIYVRR